VLFALQLGAGFATASAELVSTSPNAIEVDLHVELTGSASSVVAHLSFPGHPELILPMISRGERVWGVTTELEPLDYQVVFESLGDQPAISSAHSLSDLGVDFGIDVTSTTAGPDDEGLSDESTRRLWLAVAFGAAALSALAFWVLGGGSQDSSDEVSSTEDSGTSGED
ncbi:MAG: hypothetical protein KDB69_07885, partial [Acidimicrobiia bacterium]|nr:hypothetical protein [Acidimicrobiia bacterium]